MHYIETQFWNEVVWIVFDDFFSSLLQVDGWRLKNSDCNTLAQSHFHSSPTKFISNYVFLPHYCTFIRRKTKSFVGIITKMRHIKYWWKSFECNILRSILFHILHKMSFIEKVSTKFWMRYSVFNWFFI